MDIPKNLLYTNDHEWIKVDGDSAVIGITDHAQSELGDIVFVELPNCKDTFSQNDIFGTIEAVKTLADLFIPVSGEIIEVNESLDSTPENINSDPYNKGWLVKIKISDKSELTSLLDSVKYSDMIK